MFIFRSNCWLAAAIFFFTACCSPKPAEPPATPPSQQVVTGRTNRGADAIIVLSPVETVAGVSPAAPAFLRLAGYEILPKLLVVQTGQTVRFSNRNSEDEVHSIRVTELAGETPLFNVGTVPYGSSDHIFQRTGFFRVACDIHPPMRADILVVDSPYSAITGTDGGFRIPDVPAGSYRLTIYSGDARVTRLAEVKDGRTELQIEGY